MAHSQGTAAAFPTGGSGDGSAEDGNKMDTAEVSAGTAAPRRHRGKRPLPVPNLDAIEDPVEKKLQRRLLKNRRTAAASRERKQKEMERLVARVQALQAVNEELRDTLEQRNMEILMLRMEMPAKPLQAPAALKLSPSPAAHSVASVFRGNLPLHRSFSAWPGCHGQPRYVPGSLSCSPGQPWPELGHPQSNGSVAWNAVARSLSLPDGGPVAAAQLRPSAIGCTEAPLLGQPLSMPLPETISVKSLSLPSCNLSSAEAYLTQSRSISASGPSADAESGFFRGLNRHSLRLSSVSTRQLSIEDLPMSCPLEQLDGQPLRGRAFSCPVPGAPVVESVGGTCPSRQLLQPRPDLDPPHRLGTLHVAQGYPDMLSPTDPAGLDEMDSADLWHAFD